MTAKIGTTTNKHEIRYMISLEIPDDIYQKIMYWVDKSSYEVSWWGLLDYIEKENKFVVKEVFLLDQKVGGASTEISANAMHKLLYETKDSPYKLRWWGHSHVKMNVFWSSTDVDTMMENSQNGWLLSTVFNQYRKMKTAIVTGSPMSLFIDDIPTKIVSQNSYDEDWEKEYNEKVKACEYKYVSTKNYYSQDEYQYFKNYKSYISKDDDDDDDDKKKTIKIGSKNKNVQKTYDERIQRLIDASKNRNLHKDLIEDEFVNINELLEQESDKPSKEDMEWHYQMMLEEKKG